MRTWSLFQFVCAAVAAHMLASSGGAAERALAAVTTDAVFGASAAATTDAVFGASAAATGALFGASAAATVRITNAPAPPSVLDVKRAIGRLQEKGITIFTRDVGIDSAEGIADLFRRCRADDERIAAQGSSKVAAKFEKCYTSAGFTTSVGLVHMHGKYFDLMAPRTVPGTRGARIAMDDKARIILDAADAAFAAAADALVMGRFMDWSVFRGRIFLVTDRKLWPTAFAMQPEPRPVMSVVQPKGTREFFVATTAATNDYACQAIAYAVAAAVLGEFAAISSGKADAKEPLFFATGFAADIAKLEAALTIAGPVQVDTYTVARKTNRVRQCVPGFVPPLKAKRLMPLDTLVALGEYPTGGEDMFHLVRQCGALVSALRTKGPLATVAMARAMAEGHEFRKEIGNSYAAIQRDLEGCETASGTDAMPTKSKFPEYDRFSLLIDPVFYELTEEYLTEQARQKAKEEQQQKSKKAPAGT